MKKSVVKYGLIGGAISILMMLCVTINLEKSDHGVGSEVFGYIAIILSSLPIYFGVAHYAKHAVEKPGFLKQLGAGLLIALIIGICYALTWTILYYTVFPDFLDKYIACMKDNAVKAHKTTAELQKLQEQANMFRKMYATPLSIFFFTLITEPLPVGIVVSLVSATIIWLKSRSK